MAKKKSSPKAKATKKAPAAKKPAAKKAVANKKTAPKKKVAVKKPIAKKPAPAKKTPAKKIATAKKTVSKPVKKVAIKKPVPKKAAPKTSPIKKIVKKVVKVVKEVAKVPAAALLKETKTKRRKVKKVEKKPEPPKHVVDSSIGKNYTPPISSKVGYVSNPNNSKATLPPPPSERKATPDDDKYIALKRDVLSKCIEMQTNIVNTAKKAMDEAQESANEEKGSTEEKFDSFRESMQIARDMHARQVAEGMDGLGLLKRISIVPLVDHVKLGSIVCTTLQNYFISASLGEIDHNGKNYMAISTMTPLYQALSGKQKGDKFYFRDGEYKITNVF
jgi:hypothetical protein